MPNPKDSPTPAGSESDSDMYSGASSSQSCESGVEPRQGEGISKRDRYVAQIEHMEKTYRSWGAFEAAVQAQRSAAYIASGGELGKNFCCWFDRGIDRRPYWFEAEHLLIVQLPNTMQFFMPKDTQLELWIILTQALKLTSDDLLDAAHELYLAEQRAIKEPQQESPP